METVPQINHDVADNPIKDRSSGILSKLLMFWEDVMFPKKDANVEKMGPSGSQISNIYRGKMQLLVNGT